MFYTEEIRFDGQRKRAIYASKPLKRTPEGALRKFAVGPIEMDENHAAISVDQAQKIYAPDSRDTNQEDTYGETKPLSK